MFARDKDRQADREMQGHEQGATETDKEAL